MARNSAYNSLARKALRRARRLHFDFGTGKVSVPVIHVPTQISTEMLVSSFFNLLSASPFQRKVLNEAKKVRKRVLQLMKEGYTFPDYIMDLVFGDEISISKKTLERLKQMDMFYLRTHAASYQGETDINKIIALHNKEVAAKRRAAIEAQKESEEREQYEGRSVEDIHENEIPEDWDLKIHNIIEEEQAYINECLFFLYGFAKDNEHMIILVNEAVSLARSVIEKVMNITEEEARIIIDYWESPGMINRIINDAETRFKGLFYDVPYFNEHVLGLFPGGSQIAFNRKFSEGDFEPASQYDFFNDVEDEDEY